MDPVEDAINWYETELTRLRSEKDLLTRKLSLTKDEGALIKETLATLKGQIQKDKIQYKVAYSTLQQTKSIERYSHFVKDIISKWIGYMDCLCNEETKIHGSGDNVRHIEALDQIEKNIGEMENYIDNLLQIYSGGDEMSRKKIEQRCVQIYNELNNHALEDIQDESDGLKALEDLIEKEKEILDFKVEDKKLELTPFSYTIKPSDINRVYPSIQRPLTAIENIKEVECHKQKTRNSNYPPDSDLRIRQKNKEEQRSSQENQQKRSQEVVRSRSQEMGRSRSQEMGRSRSQEMGHSRSQEMVFHNSYRTPAQQNQEIIKQETLNSDRRSQEINAVYGPGNEIVKRNSQDSDLSFKQEKGNESVLKANKQQKNLHSSDDDLCGDLKRSYNYDQRESEDGDSYSILDAPSNKRFKQDDNIFGNISSENITSHDPFQYSQIFTQDGSGDQDELDDFLNIPAKEEKKERNLLFD